MPRPGNCSRSSRPPPELDPAEPDPAEVEVEVDPVEPVEPDPAEAELLGELDAEEPGVGDPEPRGLGDGRPVLGEVVRATTVPGSDPELGGTEYRYVAFTMIVLPGVTDPFGMTSVTVPSGSELRVHSSSGTRPRARSWASTVFSG